MSKHERNELGFRNWMCKIKNKYYSNKRLMSDTCELKFNNKNKNKND